MAQISRLTRRNFVNALGVAAGSGAAIRAALAQQSDPWQLDTTEPLNEPAVENPDPVNIKARGRGWLVQPTGGDDHDNLEWALRNTQAGGTVRLVSGTYKLSTVVIVADFNGSLVGNGAQHTTVTCTDEFSYELWEAPGGGKDLGLPKPPPLPRVPVDNSSTLAAPGYFMMYKTPLKPGELPAERANRIEVKNIRFRGACLGAMWALGDEILALNIVNSMDWHHPESTPATTRQDVLISGIEVDGYRSTEFGFFENACACVTVMGGLVLTANFDLNGVVDGDAFGIANGALLGWTKAEGDVTFDSCTFRNCRLGPGVVGYENGTLTWVNNTTDGCRGNCLQIIDTSNCRIEVQGNDLFCDSFLFPPEVTGGATDVPSSLGCVFAFQGMASSLGVPNNVRWASLAFDETAHDAHPEAGPVGTWRPLGSGFAPSSSEFNIRENSCRSSETPNTYCFHVIDLAHYTLGTPTVNATLWDNDCHDSETCISLEHVAVGLVGRNDCASRAYGVELHNSPNATVFGNRFAFDGAGCEIRMLSLGDKIDFSRVVPGAGSCAAQG